MTYVPVYCSRCAHASLSPVESAGKRVFCAFCEEVARAVPGPLYDDRDWLAFADIDRALFDADLTREQAAALAAEIELMLQRGEENDAITSTLVERCPALIHARPALSSAPGKNLKMLGAQLLGRSFDRETAA